MTEPPTSTICVICGYPNSYKAAVSSAPACYLCAEKIYFATNKPAYPSDLEYHQKRWKEIGGDGFEGWNKEIEIAKEQFKKLQDHTQYKVGDRLQVRIKNGEEVWATVLEYRDASKDVLLFLDKDFASGIYHSWTTVDNFRMKTAKELGLNSIKPNCFWWGDFSDAYYAGSKDIAVINYKPFEGKVKAPAKMHYEYNPGDRIRIKIRGGAPIWATFAEKGASDKNSLIYLDLPDAGSWDTIRNKRKENLQKLGLDSKQKKCLFWGDSHGTTSTRYLNNDIEVIEHKPTTPITSEYWFDCETEIQAGIEVKPLCKDHKKHDASQMKVYAALKKDKSVEITHLCPDQYNRQDEYGWKRVFDKLIPLATGRATSYKIGDRIQVSINEHITWATVIDDVGYLKNRRQPMLHLDQPHKGAHHDVIYEHIENVKKMGFDTTKNYFWWLEEADEVLYHQTSEAPKKEITHKYNVGDTVKYLEDDCAGAKKDHTYKITKIDRDGIDSELDAIYLDGLKDTEFLYARRFKKLPHAIGTRIEIEYGDKRSWATIVGYETGRDGVENPIAYLDASSLGFGGSLDAFSKNKSDITKNLNKFGLNPYAYAFWIVLKSDQITFHNAVLDSYDAPKLEPWPKPFLIDTPSIDYKDIVIKIDNVKNVNANDLWIAVNNAQNYQTTAASNTVSWDAWDKIKEELVASFVIDPEKVNYDGKTWFAQYGNEPPKNVIPKEPEKSFGSMIKEDATSAGYRVVAGQLTKGVKSALLKFMEDHGADNNKIVLIQEFLDTEMGSAFIGMLLGYSLTYAPKISEDPRAKRLAGEFRVGGMTVAGNALMDIVWQYVRNLPLPEKVRVSEKEVRIAEDISEEVEENEKSSRSSNN